MYYTTNHPRERDFYIPLSLNPMFNSPGFVLSVGQLIQFEASVAELCRYSHCDAWPEGEEGPPQTE